MNEKKRKNLMKLLGELGTAEDVQEVRASYASKKAMKDNFETIAKRFETMSKTEDFKGLAADLRDAIARTRGDFRAQSNALARAYASSIEDIKESLSENLKDLGGTITTSYEQNKPVNAAGTYKDMLNQLSKIDKSIIDKPVPVWNWPQYAAVSVRNKNFANINPSTEESSEWGAGYSNGKVTIDTDNGVAYIAAATPGTAQATPEWQAQRIDYSDLANITIEWANGNQDFVNPATDLTILTYS